VPQHVPGARSIGPFHQTSTISTSTISTSSTRRRRPAVRPETIALHAVTDPITPGGAEIGDVVLLSVHASSPSSRDFPILQKYFSENSRFASYSVTQHRLPLHHVQTAAR
jgi:hypothetical protein